GFESDYLANVVSEVAFNAESEILGSSQAYPYPLDSEMGAVNKAYDTLFKTLKTKKTDKGVAIYEPTEEYGQFDVFAENKKLSDGLARADKSKESRAGRQGHPSLRDRATVVANVKTSVVKTGIIQVTSPEDALHVISPINKNAQEIMVALVLDSDGNVLQLVKHTKGLADSSQVDVDHLIGSILDVPGAKSVYFAHNHPSGNPEQSFADKQITFQLGKIMQGTGLESKGMLVTGDAKKGSIYKVGYADMGSYSSELFETKATRNKSIPVTERVFQKKGKLKDTPLTDPRGSEETIKKVSKGRSGFVLLDNSNTPVSFIEMSLSDMGKLKTDSSDSGVGMILRELHVANARAVMVNVSEKDFPLFPKNEEDPQKNLDNVARFINSLPKTRMLDAFVQGMSRSVSNRVDFPSISGPFYSKAVDKELKNLAIIHNLSVEKLSKPCAFLMH
ncbi:MAG: JAB domain-containing protein, partial [Nitrospinaceae bacterium]